MSRTDKHRPPWVQARDRVPGTREVHNHIHGPCDIDEATNPWRMPWLRWSKWRWPRESNCYLHLSAYGTPSDSCWPHPGRRGRKTQYHHEQRAAWREARHKLLKDPEYDGPLFRQNRGWVLWDEW